jgi:acyl-CoA reductase-like NAD-dependent aldehyde dehydrogenase
VIVVNKTFQKALSSELAERKEKFAELAAESQGIPRRYTEAEVDLIRRPLENVDKFLSLSHPERDSEEVLGKSDGSVGLELPSVPVLYLMTVTRELMAGNKVKAKIKEDNIDFMKEIVDSYRSVAEDFDDVEDVDKLIDFDSWSHENFDKTRQFIQETDRTYTFTGDEVARLRENRLEDVGLEDEITIFSEGYSGIVILPSYEGDHLNEIVESFTWANGLYCENAGFLAYPVGRDTVLEQVSEETSELKLGDPLDPESDIGSYPDHIRQEFDAYIDKIETLGYEIIQGGEGEGGSIQPTIVKIPRHKGESYRKIDDELVFSDNMFPLIFAFPYDEKEHVAKKIDIATESTYRGYPLSIGVFGEDQEEIDYMLDNVEAEDHHIREGTHRVDTMGPHEGEWMIDYITRVS